MKRGDNRRIPIQWIEQGDGCWICTSHKAGNNGYFRIRRGNVKVALHRFIYEQCFGEIPAKMEVRHRCNNRLCINPEHLEIGTTYDNHHDRSTNGTWNAGERNGMHKLTWKTVSDIRKFGKPHGYSVKLSKRFGVTASVISQVANRRIWITDVYGRKKPSHKRIS